MPEYAPLLGRRAQSFRYMLEWLEGKKIYRHQNNARIALLSNDYRDIPSLQGLGDLLPS